MMKPNYSFKTAWALKKLFSAGLEVTSTLPNCSTNSIEEVRDLNAQVSSERENEGVAIGLLGVEGTVMDGRGNI
jgi:hypothetical protein